MKSGFLIVDKLVNHSSTLTDNIIKRNFKLDKVGHLGTLDPFATGLLIIGINDATKLFPLIDDSDKEYIATLKLGEETDTLDLKGKIIEAKEVRKYQIEEIKEVLSSFLGESKQIPPRYSAKHIDGVRSYLLANENKDIKPKEIDINIYNIELIQYDDKLNTITFKCKVSKGTYIRSLGLDIAKKLNTIGHLISLRRTKIGNIDISKAKTVDQINEEDIIKIDEFCKDIKVIGVDDKIAKDVINGKEIDYKYLSDYVFIKHNDEILAIYQYNTKGYKCYKGCKHD